ncbi:hypothetical protein [Sphaerotilus sp.]|uniref:WD40 repeat domain-containing protein n=1 Tax=Sphaerotilus sp. TaxID=2093942 RepID=UPI00286EAE8A|nr:hypothetical protein [Sphaerotilus sp.]
MTTRRWMRLWALLVLWWLGSAQAGEPTTQPLLRLETGMHTASIRRIATDATGRWAVTVSHDKTARIWDLATSRLLGVLRVPQENGREGKLNSVAISPDGEYIAVSGQTTIGSEKGNVIYIFERLTQNQKMRVTNISSIVTSLAYSPDGRWIAALLHNPPSRPVVER